MEKEKRFQKAADLLRAIAHPTRIMILDVLLKKTECVRDFENIIEKRQANISQHLAILRNQGIIDYIQEGKKRCYYLKKPKEVKKILRCLRNIS